MPRTIPTITGSGREALCDTTWGRIWMLDSGDHSQGGSTSCTSTTTISSFRVHVVMPRRVVDRPSTQMDWSIGLDESPELTRVSSSSSPRRAYEPSGRRSKEITGIHILAAKEKEINGNK